MATESSEHACPVHRIKTDHGDDAVVVTGHERVRSIFSDKRFGRSHPDPGNAPRKSASVLFGGPLGNFDTEWEDHERFRTLFKPHFSPKRMRELHPRVEVVTAELLDEMERTGSPADLHAALAVPLPVMVICELFGVPTEDRPTFRAWSHAIFDKSDGVRSGQAGAECFAYCMTLVQRKRTDPAPDILSRLCMETELPDDVVATLGMTLLMAGHESTVIEIGLGVLELLKNPHQWQTLTDSPGLIPNAVEELLRVHTSTGFIRYARTDMEIEGVPLATGDLVLLDVDSANHDPSVFTDPNVVDFTRKPGSHLSLGYGLRYCLGAPLARVELQVVYTQLIKRFPSLRLAVDPATLKMRDGITTGGLTELPVEW